TLEAWASGDRARSALREEAPRKGETKSQQESETTAAYTAAPLTPAEARQTESMDRLVSEIKNLIVGRVGGSFQAEDVRPEHRLPATEAGARESSMRSEAPRQAIGTPEPQVTQEPVTVASTANSTGTIATPAEKMPEGWEQVWRQVVAEGD